MTISEINTEISDLLDRIEAGEDIVLARRERPVARLERIPQLTGQRKFGSMRGLIEIWPEFFEPLPSSELPD